MHHPSFFFFTLNCGPDGAADSGVQCVPSQLRQLRGWLQVFLVTDLGQAHHAIFYFCQIMEHCGQRRGRVFCCGHVDKMMASTVLAGAYKIIYAYCTITYINVSACVDPEAKHER